MRNPLLRQVHAVEKELCLVLSLYTKSQSKSTTNDWWQKKFRIVMDREKVIDLLAQPLPKALNHLGEMLLQKSVTFWLIFIKS
jgi:hypothetical protein